MKVFVKFLEDPELVMDIWEESITAQVKELMELFRAFNEIPFCPFSWEEGETPPIFVMEQYDTRARYVLSPMTEGRLWLIEPLFVLRYEWEQEEFDEYCKDYDIKPEVIPISERDKDYVSLGSIDLYAEEVQLDFSKCPNFPTMDDFI